MAGFFWEVVVPLVLFLLMFLIIIGIPVYFFGKLMQGNNKEFWEKENELIDELEEDGIDARW